MPNIELSIELTCATCGAILVAHVDEYHEQFAELRIHVEPCTECPDAEEDE